MATTPQDKIVDLFKVALAAAIEIDATNEQFAEALEDVVEEIESTRDLTLEEIRKRAAQEHAEHKKS